MKQNLTELVFILDRSGSMQGLEGDTTDGMEHASRPLFGPAGERNDPAAEGTVWLGVSLPGGQHRCGGGGGSPGDSPRPGSELPLRQRGYPSQL